MIEWFRRLFAKWYLRLFAKRIEKKIEMRAREEEKEKEKRVLRLSNMVARMRRCGFSEQQVQQWLGTPSQQLGMDSLSFGTHGLLVESVVNCLASLSDTEFRKLAQMRGRESLLALLREIKAARETRATATSSSPIG